MEPLLVIRYIIGAIVLILAVYAVVLNWASFFINSRNQRNGIDRHVSMIPILGGLLLPVSLFIMPLELSWHIWFVSLVDPSILAVVVVFPMLTISINLKRFKDRSH